VKSASVVLIPNQPIEVPRWEDLEAKERCHRQFVSLFLEFGCDGASYQQLELQFIVMAARFVES